MSSSEINPETASPPRRNWLIVLLVIVVIGLLGVNGWLAYQTWMLNQTLTQFVASRSAPPFANGAFPTGEFPNAAGVAGRRAGAVTATTTDSAVAQAPAAEDTPMETPVAGATSVSAAPAADAMPGSAGPAAGRTREGGGRPMTDGSAFSPPAAGEGAPGSGSAIMSPMAADSAPVAEAEEPTTTAPADRDRVDTAGEAVIPTPTAENDAVLVASIPVVSGVRGARVWDNNGNLMIFYDSGVTLSATGRSSNGNWLIVESEVGPGWVETSQVIGFGLQQLAESTLPASTALAPLLGSGNAAPPPAVGATDQGGETPAELPTPDEVLLAVTPDARASVPSVTATVAISDARLNVRSGPGLEYPILAKAAPGAIFVVTGRTSTGEWLQLRMDDVDGTVGWVDAAYLEVVGDTATLPEPEFPPPPTRDSAARNGPAVATAGPTSVQTVDATAADADLAGTIVFQQSRGGMIYVYRPATGALQPLAQGFDPAISPDGRTVAFTRDGGETGIYLIGVDGSNERRIFERPSLSSPKWSPDGKWILFSRNDDFIECYEVGFNQCLTPEVFAKRFPFAKPGQFTLSKEYQYKLSAVDFDGQNFHDIPALDSARAPDWSEGGIVYQSKAGIQRTADGPGVTTQEVAFNNLNPFYFDPDWQPNGGQIVFQLKGAAQTDIWVVNPDGSGMHGLTAPATALVDQMPSNVAPAYSPDGAHIVFLSNRDEHNAAGSWRIWVMDADGSNQRPLAIDIPVDYSYGLEQAVSWGS